MQVVLAFSGFMLVECLRSSIMRSAVDPKKAPASGVLPAFTLPLSIPEAKQALQDRKTKPVDENPQENCHFSTFSKMITVSNQITNFAKEFQILKLKHVGVRSLISIR